MRNADSARVPCSVATSGRMVGECADLAAGVVGTTVSPGLSNPLVSNPLRCRVRCRACVRARRDDAQQVVTQRRTPIACHTCRARSLRACARARRTRTLTKEGIPQTPGRMGRRPAAGKGVPSKRTSGETLVKECALPARADAPTRRGGNAWQAGAPEIRGNRHDDTTLTCRQRLEHAGCRRGV